MPHQRSKANAAQQFLRGKSNSRWEAKCQVGGHLLGRLLPVLGIAFAVAKALFLAFAAAAAVLVFGGFGPLGALGRRARHVVW